MSGFYAHTAGHRHTCKVCTAAKARKWQSENKEARNAIVRKSRAANQKWREYSNSYKSAHGETSRRRAAKRLREPVWLTKEELQATQAFYQIRARVLDCTGIDLHVDHEVPLNGRTVSGLHVPWNLSLIPKVVNLRKSNKLILNAVSA